MGKPLDAELSFSFEGPLTTTPASFLPPTPPKRPVLPNDRSGLEAALQAVLPSLGDDVTVDDVIIAMGFSTETANSWHRTCIINALIGDDGLFMGAIVPEGGLRFKRTSIEPCPGYDQRGLCGAPVLGGGLCPKCADREDEDLWDQP